MMSEKRKERDEMQLSASKEVQSVSDSSDILYEIDIIELSYRILANWKKILCLAITLAIIFAVYTVFLVTPMYEATSIIYVLNPSDSAINFSDLQLGTALTQDYIKVFKMWEVHEEVVSNLNLSYTYSEIQSMLSIKNDEDTRMLDITVTSPDPSEAAVIANEYAEVASQYIADTMSTDKPNIMSVALVPTNPVSPNKTCNTLIGFLLGTAFGCFYEALRYKFDDKYKTAEDIKKYTGLATLAIVPMETRGGKKGSVRRR